MHRPITILSTKVLRATSQARAAQEDCLLDMLPFIRIEYAGLPEGWAGGADRITAIFTSAHAVSAYAALEEQPEVSAVFCIAGATERTVQELLPGVRVLASRPYAAELVAVILQQQAVPEAPLFFFCGDQRMATVPDGLTQAGIAFEERVVYRNIACPQLIAKDYDGILFFSPSAVHSYFSCNALPEQTLTFAIGHTTASALKQYTDRVQVAPQTDEAVLVAYAIEYCKQIKK